MLLNEPSAARQQWFSVKILRYRGLVKAHATGDGV